MANPKHLTLGGAALPVDLDALEALPAWEGVMQFDFSWRGVRFAARAEDDGEGTAQMKVVGTVGRLPFSAEAPAARSGLSAIIMHANGLLGRIFRLDGERIVVGMPMTVDTPVTATRLLTALSTFLIPLSPYLDLMALYYEPGGERLKPEWRKPSRLPAAPPRLLPAPGA